MQVSGTIGKDGSLWVVLVRTLGAFAHGRTRAAACEAAAAIIRLRAAGYRALDGFEVEIVDDADGTVRVVSNDSRRMFSTVLRYQRELHGLSLADVTKKLGAKSRTSYAVYEQGKAEPGIEKLEQLLAVVAPELALGIVTSGRSVGDEVLPLRQVADEQRRHRAIEQLRARHR